MTSVQEDARHDQIERHSTATATAMTACTIVVVEKQEMVRQLHANPAVADRFLSHMLTRNIRLASRLVSRVSSSNKLVRVEKCAVANAPAAPECVVGSTTRSLYSTYGRWVPLASDGIRLRSVEPHA